MLVNTFQQAPLSAEYWDYRTIGTGNSATLEYFHAGDLNILSVDRGLANEFYLTTVQPMKYGSQARAVKDVDGTELFPTTVENSENILIVNQIDFVLDAFGHLTGYRYRMTRKAI